MGGLKKAGVELVAEGSGPFQKALEDAHKSVSKLGEKGADAARGVGELASKAGGAIGHVSNLAGAAGGLAKGLGDAAKKAEETAIHLGKIGVVAGAAGAALIGGFGFKANAFMETAQAGFTTIMGSADAAKQHIEDLKKFGANTPFETKDLITYSQQLQAMGLNANEVIPELTGIGNAVAALGGGGEMVGRVTLALGQMLAKGKVSGDEMLQLTSAGIPAWDMLAKGLGVTTAEAMKLSEKGLIPAKQANDILIDQMNKKFPDMMKNMSGTMTGMLSNLQDWAFQSAEKVTKPFFEIAKVGVKALMDFTASPAMGQFIDKLTAVGQKAGEGLLNGLRLIQAGFTGNTDIFGQLGKFDKLSGYLYNFGWTLKQIEPSIKTFMGALRGKWDPTGHEDEINGLVLSIGKFGQVLRETWGAVKPFVTDVLKISSALSPLSILFDALKGFSEGGIGGALDAVGKHFTDVFTAIGDLGSRAGDFLGPLVQGISDWIGKVFPIIVEQVGKWAQAFIDWVGPMIPQVLGALGELLPQVVSWLGGAVVKIVEGLAKWADAFWQWISPAIPKLLENLGEFIKAFYTWYAGVWTNIVEKLAEWGKAFVQWVLDALPPLLQNLGTFLGDLLGWIVAHVPDIVGKLVEWATAFLGWVWNDLLPQLPGVLWNIIQAVLNFIWSAAGQIGPKLLEWSQQIWTWVLDVASQIPGKLWDVITAVFGWIMDQAKNFPQNLVKWTQEFWNWITDLVGKLPGKLWDIISGIGKWIGEQLPKLGDYGKQIGSAIIDGITNLIKGAAGLIGDAIKSILPDGQTILGWIGQRITGAGGNYSTGAGPGMGGKYGLPAKAAGGWASGLTLVGEKGPELLWAPRGSYVWDAAATRNIISPPMNPSMLQQAYSTTYSPSYQTTYSLNVTSDQPSQGIIMDYALMRAST